MVADLQRFQRNDPILARSPGHWELFLRWMRRRPATAASLFTVLPSLSLALAGGLWLLQQRAERRAELRTRVGTALTRAENLRREYHLREARELLEQTWRLAPAEGADHLHRLVEQAKSELELLEILDAARLRGATLVEGKFVPAGAGPLYAETFAKAGLGGPQEDSDTVAARMRQCPVSVEIVAALDDWASITTDPARLEWLLAVARASDPDPLRDQLRQAKLPQDGIGLKRLVQELRVEDLPPGLQLPRAAS